MSKSPDMIESYSYEKACDKLLAVIQRVSLARSLDDIMEIVRHAARDLTRADGATFILREGDHCYYAEEDAISPLWKGRRFPMKICISGWVMQHRQIVVMEDIYSDPRIPAEAYRPTFVKSLAMVPIRVEAPIGAIGVYWAQPRRPQEHELKVLQALAGVVSVAIENVHLYASLEDRICQLNAANRAKDEFLMTLSHELRTPLNAILGWSELLLSNGMDPSEMNDGLKTIYRNAAVQVRLINELLDSTRILTGRFTLEKKPLDLSLLIQDGVKTIQTMAASKSIELIYKPAVLFGTMDGDIERLQQVFGNLLANALKFTPKGGRIELKAYREGPSACIEVNDNGEGMDPNALPHIFERFNQADNSVTRKHGGLGLGLAIVHSLVEAHGGTVSAESPGLGQGSTFKVWLPLSTIRQDDRLTEEESANLSEKLPLGRVRVLVVDDEPDARCLVKAILNRQGAEVWMAESATEAASLLKANRPHVLVCDLSMPGTDGCSFIRSLRSQSTPLKLPAIALTAFADREHEREALTAGFDAFMGKPLQSAKLIETIASMVGALAM